MVKWWVFSWRTGWGILRFDDRGAAELSTLSLIPSAAPLIDGKAEGSHARPAKRGQADTCAKRDKSGVAAAVAFQMGPDFLRIHRAAPIENSICL